MESEVQSLSFPYDAKQPWLVNETTATMSNDLPSIRPGDPFFFKPIETTYIASTPKSYVPVVVLTAKMRGALRRYQRRSTWLPSLISHLLLAYPYPLEGEVCS